MAPHTCLAGALRLWFPFGGHFLGPNISSRCVSFNHSYPNVHFSRIYSVKTKVQQRVLAGEQYRGIGETFHRLIRGEFTIHCISPSLIRGIGPDPEHPKPLLAGIARIYRGLGVSALRSVTTHGLLWTFFDLVSNYIDRLPEQAD